MVSFTKTQKINKINSTRINTTITINRKTYHNQYSVTNIVKNILPHI